MKSYPIFLNGKWHEGGKKLHVINPATGEPFAQVATMTRDQVGLAIDDAQSVFPLWSQLTAMARGDFLLAIAHELGQRTDQVARSITLENGKPLAQSLAEVAMTIDHLRWFAEEGRRAYGRFIPHQVNGKRHMVLKSPMGVVGCIAPWNFPLVLSVRKVAPALAAGCPVLLKPSSKTPLCAVEFARCIEAAKLPAGVFQLVLGPSEEIGQAMLNHPACRKISFTGSTEVGKRLLQGVSANLTKFALELGGNAPVLIFEDSQINQAVTGAIITKFRNSGQSCIAANRIYVQRPIFDQFLDAFVARTKSLKVGNGLEEGVEVGPLIDRHGLENVLDLIEDAKTKGARLLCGGQRKGDQGFFLEPTVMADVPNDARCNHEEIFAPFAPVIPFDNEDEAIQKANHTEYGLSAYAFTRDLGRAMRLAEKLESGTIGINDPVPTTSQCPFGGCKESGWGRELGAEGLDAFLETKHVSIGSV